MTPWQLAGLAAGVTLALGVLLLLLYLIVQKQIAALRSGRAAPSPRGDLDVREDIQKLVEELNRMADDIDQRLNRRLIALEKAMAEADRKLSEARSPAGESPEDEGSYRPIEDPGRAEVVRLHGQGLDTLEIARRMDMDVGEVELVLNLDDAQRNDER